MYYLSLPEKNTYILSFNAILKERYGNNTDKLWGHALHLGEFLYVQNDKVEGTLEIFKN